MATANERQVGGEHYKGSDYQHWDWVQELQMEYLPATATKYVARWRRKNGKQDLEKALHYIDKAEECGVREANPFNKHKDKMAPFWRFVLENRLNMVDAVICYYIMEAEWEAARLAVSELLTQTA